jgi:hypothetical protein
MDPSHPPKETKDTPAKIEPDPNTPPKNPDPNPANLNTKKHHPNTDYCPCTRPIKGPNAAASFTSLATSFDRNAESLLDPIQQVMPSGEKPIAWFIN